MDVYRGHYGEGLGDVLAGVARRAIPLMAPMARRLGSSLINKGLRALYGAVGGTPAAPAAARRRRRRPAAAAPASRGVVKRKSAKRTSSLRRAKQARTKADIFDGTA